MSQYFGNYVAKSVVETAINVPNNTWTALPTTAFNSRNYVRIYNKGEHKLYLSFDSSASVKDRTALGASEMMDFPINENLTVYGRSDPNVTGSVKVIVQEYK